MTETEQRSTIGRSHDTDTVTESVEQGPDSPDLPRTQWKSVFKRTLSEFGKDGGSDLAAALTYYSIMSLAPMLLALSTSLTFLGQVTGGAAVEGDSAIHEAIDDLGGDLGVEQATLDTVKSYIDSMGESGGAGLLLVVGLVGALWSASNYVNAFSRMMNKVYNIDEGRPVWKLRPWLLALTLLVVVGLIVIILSVTLSGTLSELLFGFVGLSGVATTVWNWAKWPFILLMLMGIVGLLYWGTPNVRQKFRWLSPGAALAVIVAIIAAAGFFIYLTGFGGEDSYNATYGAIGGVIILLLMIFIINNVLVIGAELDAELERGRELAAGLPAEEDVLLPPRDVKGTAKKADKQAEAVREARELRMRAAAALRRAGRTIGLEGRGRGRGNGKSDDTT